MAKTIQERVKEIAASAAAPSMVPTERLPAPPAKEVEVVPDLSEFVTDKKQRLAVLRLITEYGELGAQKHEIQGRQDKLAKAIKTVAGEMGLAKCVAGDYRLSYFVVPRSTLKVDKLLSAGVSPEIIQRCTVTTESYNLRVVRLEDEDE